ncbi:MAG: kelch repeat-containing protein [Gammaproteobacteria bacterium]
MRKIIVHHLNQKRSSNMFSHRLKRLKTRAFSAGSSAMLSMLVTFVGTLPQPVAAADPVGFPLAIERSGHTATALQNGDVLITGGKSADGATVLDSSEIVNALDPSSAQPATASLGTPRTGHTATKLSNGDILVAGGSNGSGALDSTETYDAASNSWTPGASLQTPRSGHTATQLSGGQVLIVGGDSAGTAEIYGGAAVGSLNTPRSKHSAIKLADGKVLIVGGVGSDNAPLKSAELYNPSTASFSTVPTELASARVKPDLRLLQDGKVQVIGGAGDANAGGSFELYDPDSSNPKPGFNAKATAVNSTNAIDDVLSAQTRASIFGGSGPLLSDILNRTGHALTEIAQPAPNPSKVLISGGTGTGGALTNSAYVIDGSPATITTNWTDYAPGTDVVVYTKGWIPGETIDVMLHVDNAGVVRDLGPITWTTDANGELNGWKIYSPVAPDDVDAIFTLTAVGQTSGFVAQTAFTDNVTSVLITSPTSVSTVTVTSLPQAVTINFDYSSSAGVGHTTSAVARICSSPACSPAGSIIASNTKSLTSGSSKSDSIDVTLPAGAPNSSSPHYTVQVEVTSSSGSPGPATRTDTKTSAVIVNVSANTPPVINSDNASVTVNEGQTAMNTGTWSDVNAGDTVTLSASVGTVNKMGTNASGTWSWSYGTTDGPAQSQTVTITADDEKGGVTSTMFSLTVDNVAPTADALAATSPIDEGSSSALSLTNPTDASSVDAASLHFSFACDGLDASLAANYAAASTSNSANCMFNDNGSYTVKGRVYDKDGAGTTYQATVVVNNVPPMVAQPSFSVSSLNCRTSVNLTGISFTDPGVNDADWSVVIDWGDGSTDTTYNTATQGAQPNQSHVYNTPGTYTATVTVTDKDGGEGSNTSSNMVEVLQTYGVDFLPPFDDSTPSGLIVNKMKNGRVVPVKATIYDSCALQYVNDPASNVTIKISKTSGTGTGDPVEEYADAGQSSAGTNMFRWTSDAYVPGGGFWIYGLDSKALGLVVNNNYRGDVYLGTVKATMMNWAVFQPVK